MSEQAFWYLENIDVASIFCPRKMDIAHDNLHHKAYKKNEYIYLQDDDADKVYLLTEGRVKIGSYNDTGREITKAILTAGEVFGELALMNDGRRRDFACAMEHTKVCILMADEMRRLMREHSGLNIFFMRLLGSRLLEMENRLESLVFKDSRSRIIELLNDIAIKKGQRIGHEHVVRNFITHRDIANLTATSRQTVTAVMNELRNKNIIAFNRKQLLIRDLEQLK
jgi:CRP-like cAMP-binding protein